MITVQPYNTSMVGVDSEDPVEDVAFHIEVSTRSVAMHVLVDEACAAEVQAVTITSGERMELLERRRGAPDGGPVRFALQSPVLLEVGAMFDLAFSLRSPVRVRAAVVSVVHRDEDVPISG